MKRRFCCAIAALLTAGMALKCGQSPPAQAENPSEVQFFTSDSISVFGDLFIHEKGKSAPLILLFHQGGGNARAEYDSLKPRLHTLGFSTLAIDQRRGGDRLGGHNRTVDHLAGEPSFGYCDAYADLEAALAFVKDQGFSGKYIAWGSSYSAALVVQLAAKNTETIDAVLAFSPASGEPMAGCEPAEYAQDLKAPLLVLRPRREMEYEHVAKQFADFQEMGHQSYVAENGVHGSSMLNPARVDGSVEPQWQVVEAFLQKAITQK